VVDLTQDQQYERDEQALLRKRLSQFSAVVFVAFTLTAVQYGLQSRWDIVGFLLGGAASMAGCMLLARQHQLPSASLLLWTSVTVVVSAIMWRSDGLHDSTLLAYPVILIGAGQLLKPRYFFGLLAAMLLCVMVIGLGSLWGLRTDVTPGTEVDRLTDTLTILLVGGFLIWFLAYDVQATLARLKQQIARFHASEIRLTYLAQHDALTQLPNRVLGSELMEQSIASSSRRGTSMALLFVDLDNFKDINDSLGHAAGDEFLQQVSHRLRAAVRKGDVVCRQGGDEFLVGLTDLQDSEAIASVATNILEQMKAPFSVREAEILASCSIGIAVHPKDGSEFEELLRHADAAMYHAKDAGRNTYRFFDEELNATLRESLHLISSLRAAVTQKEFLLHYQPVLDMESGALVGAEALVRWHHPKIGLVAPGMFIPAAEKSGLIVDIGQWVIEEACRQARQWRDQGAAPITMAVNLSPVQFRRGNVEAIIAQALERAALEPHCLELEVTESTLVQDTEKFIQSLQRIKAQGIHISIDDFGTGYSNLSYLQRFAVDKLKIDQSFVKRLTNGPQDLAMVTAIVQMAKSLNLTTTAEGVETEEARIQLLRLGCNQAQGYLFAKPLPPEAFFAYMVQKQSPQA
jgi:diguanylate cyclase (GGDEF)-like protein